MTTRYKLTNTATLVTSLIRYNLKVIFGGKFPYFLLAATTVFVLFALLNLASTQSQSMSAFYLILMPGILLVFYPATFGIQNDVSSRMIEILFGIPNYRYKVWLFRLMLIFAVVFLMLLVYALVYALAMGRTPVLALTMHIMAPVIFIGSLAFCVSTIARSGNGTAVVMVIISLGFWLMQGQLGNTAYNPFLNPFVTPDDMNVAVWADITVKSRIYLLVGSLIAILWGLFNLQKRERFLG
ncbi:hypothetical protein GF324_05555 [bacterium]|nr:hypothetical protein [bacterium]